MYKANPSYSTNPNLAMQENALELNNPLNAVSGIEYIEGVIEDVLCSNVDDVE